MIPEKMTDADVARIKRAVYGGSRFDQEERMFAAEVEALRDSQWLEHVQELQSRLESLEKDFEELIKERDEREDVINELLNQVLADERKEWSSAYDFDDAVIDVECKMQSLEKDAARYKKVVNSGAFVPGNYGSSPWGLASGWNKATKEELDKAADSWEQ